MRNIDGKLWSDKWFYKLSQEEKLLYIYLISTDRTNDLGIYEASFDYIKLETKIENFEKLLENGVLSSRVYYDKEKELIIVRDIHKYSFGKSKDYRRSLYHKLLELDHEIRAILLRESFFLAEIFNEFEEEKRSMVANRSGEDTHLPQSEDDTTPSIDRLPTVVNKKEKAPLKEKEKEKETSPLILSPKEKEKEKENHPQKEKSSVVIGNSNELPILVENSDAIASEILSPPPKRKTTKIKKYSDEAIKFVEEFKNFRENYLKVPVTHKNWHLKSLGVAEKLLKKYSLGELLEALSDLQTEAWSDKAPKILEMWHFEDFLPRWKVSKTTFLPKEEIYRGINITEWKKWYKRNYNAEVGGDLKKWIDWWIEVNGELPTREQVYWREEYKRIYGVYPEENQEVINNERN